MKNKASTFIIVGQFLKINYHDTSLLNVLFLSLSLDIFSFLTAHTVSHTACTVGHSCISLLTIWLALYIENNYKKI